MEIGHSGCRSMTFLPTQIKSPNSDMWYTDVAGLNDSGGALMEYINQLLIKKLFNMTEQVRLLIPLTHQQIESSRGQCVREQMEIVLKIF